MTCTIALLSFLVLAADPAADPASSPAELLGALGVTTSAPRVVVGGLTYVALDDGGIAVIDERGPTPTLVTKLLEGKKVSRLIVEGERLYVITLEESVVVLSVADPAAPRGALPDAAPAPASVAPAPSPLPARSVPAIPVARGRVREVTGGRVIIDSGGADGFRPGARVRVISQRLVKKPDLVAGGSRETPSGEVTAVVELEEVEEHGAMAVLGRGDVAAAGDVVESTEEELSERLWLPRRAPFSIRTGFHVRPFLGARSARSGCSPMRTSRTRSKASRSR